MKWFLVPSTRERSQIGLAALAVLTWGCSSGDGPVVPSPLADRGQLHRLSGNFINQIEPPLSQVPAGTPVTLAVADSSPTADGIEPGASQHGFNVAWIA